MQEETTTAAETKPRKAKAEAPYVVGKWNPEGVFVPTGQQPRKPIADFDEIVVWAKEAFKDEAGDYSFVKKMPRTLKMVEQRIIAGTLV